MKTNQAYLLDTHVFLWAVTTPSKISLQAREVLENSSSKLYLSKISYWEICLKISKGKLKLRAEWKMILEQERKRNRYLWLDIEPVHCQGLLQLPDYHKDPFDRMLISQALCENLSLISCDEKIAQYPLHTIW